MCGAGIDSLIRCFIFYIHYLEKMHVTESCFLLEVIVPMFLYYPPLDSGKFVTLLVMHQITL